MSAELMARAIPSLEDFRRLAGRQARAVVPVYVTILADHLTPVTAYERLARLSPYSFLLESVVGGERIARYSFLGTRPRQVIQAYDRQVTIKDFGGPEAALSERTFSSLDPLKELEKLLPPVHNISVPGLPKFAGGAVGFAGYDTVRYLEGEKLASAPKDDRGLPDLLFGLYDDLVIFDHVQKTVLLVANGHVGGHTAEEAFDDAIGRINQLMQALRTPLDRDLGLIDLRPERRPLAQSNFTQPQFEAAVEAAREYIKAGDIFQVVLSQRLHVQTTAEPLNIYRALRVINPSPFMFYLAAPECILVGSSPEIMCRVQDGIVTNRPLAGTRPRGKTAEQDVSLEKELLADPKERAEHIMLVDLGRNDVGRVCEPGSVTISDVMSVERYSHVMHITTNVSGRLAADKTCFDALRTALPVGTVSGAPKIRAMQIIDELEPSRRGPYAGAVGYIDYAGNMDTCIALRTMVIPGKKQGAMHSVYIQAGAGLVADSVPAAEYQETMNKAAGLLKAIAIAEDASTGT